MHTSTYHLPAATHIGYVHLNVRDIAHTSEFYQTVLGFRELRREGSTVYLSVEGNPEPLIILTEATNSQPRNQSAPGLFHTAILVPDRRELARILQHLIRNNIRLGFGDHAVSEAIYLADPEGNGVEVYADRPRDTWRFQNGNLEMTTLPVNVPDLLAELGTDKRPFTGLPAGTRIGHVHLQVSDLSRAETFYSRILGFDVTQRTYPGALFVSAGGYHHHLGLNIWHSRNAAPASPDTAGLHSFSIKVPDSETIHQVAARLHEFNVSMDFYAEDRLQLSDADGITAVITLA